MEVRILSSEIWALIGVVIGAILGFGLSLLKGWAQEKRQQKKYLEVLLSDLEYNKKLVNKNTELGYRTLGYINEKGVEYLLNLPEEVLAQIYEVQTKISLLSNPSYIFAKSQIIETLNNLLDKAIPQLKKY